MDNEDQKQGLVSKIAGFFLGDLNSLMLVLVVAGVAILGIGLAGKVDSVMTFLGLETESNLIRENAKLKEEIKNFTASCVGLADKAAENIDKGSKQLEAVAEKCVTDKKLNTRTEVTMTNLQRELDELKTSIGNIPIPDYSCLPKEIQDKLSIKKINALQGAYNEKFSTAD